MRSAGAFLGVSEPFIMAARDQHRHVRSQIRGNRQIVARFLDQSGSDGLNGSDIAFGIHKAACLLATGIELDLIGFGIELAR